MVSSCFPDSPTSTLTMCATPFDSWHDYSWQIFQGLSSLGCYILNNINRPNVSREGELAKLLIIQAEFQYRTCSKSSHWWGCRKSCHQEQRMITVGAKIEEAVNTARTFRSRKGDRNRGACPHAFYVDHRNARVGCYEEQSTQSW